MEILQILKANGIGLNNNDRSALQPGGACSRCRPWSGAPRRHQPAAGGCRPGGSTAAPLIVAPPEPTTAQRLQELETLRATGAISDDEYNAKRQQILADL